MQAGPRGFCVSAVSPPHPHPVPFLVLIRRSLITRQPYDGRPCPRGPSLLTPQLRDGPREGWPSDQPEQPPPLWGSPSAWLPPPPPPPWPPRSRHLGHAIPVEVGDGAPPPGPYIPQAPLFLFKGTDCNLGAGTRLPQPLAPQKARYRPSHRPRTGARAGGTVSPEARAPSPRRPLAYAMPSVGPCK